MQVYKGTLNNVRLIGYLRETPEVYETENGHIATVYIYTQGPYTNEVGEFTHHYIEWHRVVARDSHALLLGCYGRANMKFYIEGKIHTRQVATNDAPTQCITEIVADKFEPILVNATAELSVKK